MAGDEKQPETTPEPQAQPQEQTDQPVTFIVNGVEVDANGEPVKPKGKGK